MDVCVVPAVLLVMLALVLAQPVWHEVAGQVCEGDGGFFGVFITVGTPLLVHGPKPGTRTGLGGDVLG